MYSVAAALAISAVLTYFAVTTLDAVPTPDGRAPRSSAESTQAVPRSAPASLVGTGLLRFPAEISGMENLSQESDDGQGKWKYYSGLLPQSGPPYMTVSTNYFDPDDKVFGEVNVSGIEVVHPDHQHPLTTDPKSLVSAAMSHLYYQNPQSFSPGPLGGALECGAISGTPTTCVWADEWTEVFIDFTVGSSGFPPPEQAAAAALQFRAAIETPHS